ncbi:hypothetical protein OA5_05965 [Vibrio cyclitrophicus 1F111]|uniref:lipopolysaccharide biosynthesis protein n=1 Tax=Vibrio cyclitrophicus TaxID=47951 RepID=UPI000370BDD3|nr:hypothetical protein [Vibrio cyclitrophicus]OEF75420.1 hypothetical protein OA5_05965 [Vibrio cyclitrophicus 1F111]
MLSNQLLKNAIIMYGRMLILMILNLYISRIVLEYLGAEKYGLMSVVTGIVVIGAFLATVLETTAQRYISEALAKGGVDSVIKTIQSLSYIYVVVTIISVIVVEFSGLYYINFHLNQKLIGSEELNIIFQMSVLVFFLSSINSILLAILIAFENVRIYSLVTILDVLIKLVLVMWLNYLDSRIVYYLIILVISIVLSRLFAYFYIKKTIPYVKITPLKNNILLNKISHFVRWNLIGGFSSILTIQGLNIVINIYQDLTTNAARAFSTQLNMAILQMVNSIQLAFSPKIIKLYVNDDTLNLNKAFLLNAKLTALFTSLIIIVINYKLEYLLDIWLGDYPIILTSFIYFMLIEVYFSSFTGPLLTIIQASEKIKMYQLMVGGTMLINVPVSYAILNIYNDPLVVYYVPIFINIVCLIQRVFFVNKLKVVNIKIFFYDVFFRVTLFLLIMLSVQRQTFSLIDINDIVSKFVIMCVAILFVALTSSERRVIFNSLQIAIKIKKT